MITIDDLKKLADAHLNDVEGLLSADPDLSPIILRLFEICFDDLKKAEVGNPMSHHLIVLKHMLKIAVAENFSQRHMRRAAALSILHDISAVEKITKEHVKVAYKKSKAEGDALEFRRQQNRTLHMRDGSALAQRRLIDLNESFGEVIYDAHDIDAICDLISIHDNPSLDKPIPRSNRMMVAFREADRLWMLSIEGLRSDLKRKCIKTPTNKEVLCQFEHNLSRFKDERDLYDPSDGPFVDSETFFRTQEGWRICQQYRTDIQSLRAG